MMEIRPAAPEQLEAILGLYSQARAFMAQTGNPNQWINGYPARSQVLQDLESGCLYTCMADGNLAAVFYFSLDPEPTYAHMTTGAWLNDLPCGVTHRICVASHGAGIGAFCLDWCFRRCGNLKIDTHRDNHPMQSLLRKCGFLPCGTITLDDGGERLAYQKTL